MNYRKNKRKVRWAKVISMLCLFSLLVLSACQYTSSNAQKQQTQEQATTEGVKQAITTPTVVGDPERAKLKPLSENNAKPILAFYFSWYKQKTWCRCTMPDVPTTLYESSDKVTVKRHLTQAAQAGITGFINSWWGENDQTDQNFARVLEESKVLKREAKYHFASSLTIETNAPKLQGREKMVAALKYIRTTYETQPHFFRWKGKPVLFFWDPLGNGRTLKQWQEIRKQVDPNREMIWSAEGVDNKLLTVFDGLHLFSGGYWGLKQKRMKEVDAGFRRQIDEYNKVNKSKKIWAAGVIPGYDDRKVPNRKGTYEVPRNNGETYKVSWEAAIASRPEWITITSFNEWFEGSMIEPGTQYGTRYLELTAKFAERWHGFR